MANYTIDRIAYGGNVYILKDSSASTTDNKVSLTVDSSNDSFPITFKKGTTSPAGIYYNNNIKVNPSTGTINATAAKFTNLGADKGVFNKLIATNANINTLDVNNLTADNATVVGILDVKGDLHTNSWTNSNISSIGGSFYVAPTVSTTIATNGTPMSIAIGGSAGARTFQVTGGAFVTDAVKTYNGTTTSTVTWSIGSHVMVTGNIRSGTTGVDYPLGTLNGYLASPVTMGGPSVLVANGFTIGEVNSPALETIISALGTTNLKSYEIKISMYEIGPKTSIKPVGIMMTSYGVDKSTYIDIYGGVNVKNSSGVTIPNVRIGYLGGLGTLSTVNGETPTGWGIYTDNGYFNGTIVSSSGKIGNWSITSTSIQTGTFGAANKMYFGDSGISLGDTFKVTNVGVLTAKSGTIGGFSLNADSFYYKNAIPGKSSDTVVLYPQGIVSPDLEKALVSGGESGTSTTGTIEWDLTIGQDFGVTANGKLYARGAVISGQLLVSDDTDTNLVTQKEANEQHAALTANINKNTSSINTTNSNLNTLNTLVKQYLDSTIQKKNITNLSSSSVAKILMGLNINNSYSIGIGSDRISFAYQLKEFAYISNTQMYINNIQLIDSMQMGDKFKWVASTNRLTLMRI